MGLRGPPPTPTPILEARGSWRAGEREGEISVPVKAPPCPKALGEEARKEWRRVTKLLLAARCIAEVDMALLAAYCSAWAEFLEVEGDLRTAGKLTRTPGGMIVQSPLIGIRNRSVEKLVRLAGQFGFSPAARTRIRAAQQPQEGSGGTSRFFRTVG